MLAAITYWPSKKITAVIHWRFSYYCFFFAFLVFLTTGCQVLADGALRAEGGPQPHVLPTLQVAPHRHRRRRAERHGCGRAGARNDR